MSGSTGGNGTSSLENENADHLDLIFEITVAPSYGSKGRNSRLMHPMSVGSNGHDGMSRQSLIGKA